jgi:hypothetical protein
MSAAPDPPIPNLPLPPSGGCGCAAGCATALAGTVALAASNLAAPAGGRFGACGAAASLVWLALVAFWLALAVWQVGVCGSLVVVLGTLSRRQFADSRPAGDGVVIGFGYELLGRRFYYLRIAAEDVNSVDMSSGQATANAGHDMEDWSVAVWYRNPAPSRFVFPGSRDDLVYIVGPPGPRGQTAERLAAVVAFLRAAGIDLEPGEDETEFRRG